MKYLLVISIVVLTAFAGDDHALVKRVNWLIGTWENKTGRGSLYEHWSKANDSTLTGKSYMVKNSDTIVFENIRLVQQQQNLFYIPTVKDQNDGKPVPFTLKTITDNEMIFENPAHDFPQVISYTRITNDSLVAKISGTKNGMRKEQMFPMRRIK